MRIILIPLLCLFLLWSCKSDEPVIDPIYTDIIFQIDENPEMGQLVGIVDSTGNTGNLKLTYMDQIPAGAVEFNESTGAITIANPDIFDTEVNPEVYVSIRGKNDKVINEIEVTIEVGDVYNEIDLVIKELVADASPDYNSPDLSDYITSVVYTDEQFTTIRNSFVTGFSEITAELISDGRIISLRETLDDGQGTVEEQLYNFSFDMDGNITAVNADGYLGVLDYVLEYNQNTIAFVDQQTSYDGSITFGWSLGRITSYSDAETTIAFEYGNDNLKKQIINDSTEVEYFYDSKRNPFLAPSFLNLEELLTTINVLKALRSSNVGQGFTSIYRNQTFMNRNNIVEIVVVNPNFGLRPIRYEYLYNSEGYPTQKSIFGPVIVLEYVYD